MSNYSLMYPGFACKQWTAMLTLYLDESGLTQGEYCFLAGYIASPEQWNAFSDKWPALCDKHLQSEPLALDEHQTVPVSSRKEIASNVLEEFAACVVSNVSFEIWSALPRYYARQVKSNLNSSFDEYRLCLDGVLSDVLFDNSVLPSNQPVSWILDQYDGPEERTSAGEIIEVSLIRAFQDVRRKYADFKNRVSLFGFGQKTYHQGLQAAHLLAWQKRTAQQLGADVPLRPEHRILREAPIERLITVWFDHKIEDYIRDGKQLLFCS